jgi:hypothetical protein
MCKAKKALPGERLFFFDAFLNRLVKPVALLDTNVPQLRSQLKKTTPTRLFGVPTRVLQDERCFAGGLGQKVCSAIARLPIRARVGEAVLLGASTRLYLR